VPFSLRPPHLPWRDGDLIPAGLSLAFGVQKTRRGMIDRYVVGQGASGSVETTMIPSRV
jgi:hypothetical protein